MRVGVGTESRGLSEGIGQLLANTSELGYKRVMDILRDTNNSRRSERHDWWLRMHRGDGLLWRNNRSDWLLRRNHGHSGLLRGNHGNNWRDSGQCSLQPSNLRLLISLDY
jgi:hypothetical protein